MSLFSFLKRTPRRIYLDHGAGTPIHPDVLSAMQPYFGSVFGNASSIHAEGVTARNAIESARTDLARALQVKRSEIMFTSGGTESNNIALVGAVEALCESGVPYMDIEIITTKIEHPSVLEVMKMLERRGVIVQYASVDADGMIELASFEALLSPKTRLVSFAYANSEIGVVQDVKRLTRAVRKYERVHESRTYVHIDASQAPLWLPCRMDALGVDLMTLDAGKCYGPKGGGVLVKKHDVHVDPYLRGGAQEQGIRPGTENTPIIIGTVRAIVRAQASYEVRAERVQVLRNFFIDELLHTIPEAVLNGSREARIANNVNISIPHFDSEYAVVVLDSKGISASTKSACGGANGQGSSVVREIANEERANSTIRFTLGEGTEKRDILRTLSVLKDHLEAMRKFQSELQKQ